MQEAGHRELLQVIHCKTLTQLHTFHMYILCKLHTCLNVGVFVLFVYIGVFCFAFFVVVILVLFVLFVFCFVLCVLLLLLYLVGGAEEA